MKSAILSLVLCLISAGLVGCESGQSDTQDAVDEQDSKLDSQNNDESEHGAFAEGTDVRQTLVGTWNGVLELDIPAERKQSVREQTHRQTISLNADGTYTAVHSVELSKSIQESPPITGAWKITNMAGRTARVSLTQDDSTTILTAKLFLQNNDEFVLQYDIAPGAWRFKRAGNR